jgi:Phospholipid methyltransferase
MTKRTLPPTYFLASLALMAALAFTLPVAPLLSGWQRAIGLVPIAAGVWLNLAADRAFKELGTTVRPFERSSALATGGVFRLSRNPMYLGMVLMLIGVGVALLLGALSPPSSPPASRRSSTPASFQPRSRCSPRRSAKRGRRIGIGRGGGSEEAAGRVVDAAEAWR